MSDQKVNEKGGLSLWKISRWIVLCAMVIVLALMLKKPLPVAEPMAPTAARERSQEVETKLADLESAHQHGEASEARFSSEEINGVLQHAQTAPESPQPSAQPQPVSESRQHSEEAEPAPEISTTRIAFEGDHATGQFLVHAPGGKEIYLTVSGRIKAVDGYASFEFTQGKIGDMPVPVALLNSRLQAKLQEPETRPKLKLPDYVADIHVENGQLVMIEK